MSEPQRIQTQGDQSEAIFAIDPTFKCKDCGGNVVWAGSKQCWNCWHGGADGLQDMVKKFTPKNLGIHKKKK